jgi:hypothetical protein
LLCGNENSVSYGQLLLVWNIFVQLISIDGHLIALFAYIFIKIRTDKQAAQIITKNSPDITAWN